MGSCMWRGVIGGVFGLVLGSCGATVSSDAGTETDESCPIGTVGCPCTSGGACDAGLVCYSGLCVDPGTETAPTTTTTTAGTTTASTTSADEGTGTATVPTSTDTADTSGPPPTSSAETGQTTTGPAGCVRHVDLNVAMPGDGSSWATAFDSVQAAIDDAAAAAPCEVWVAAGMYYIYETGVTDTLTLQGGVDVYGGFDGTETMLDQRDWSANVTVLDGRAGPGSSSRVYHVVTAASDARLDGFVITEGLANGVAPHERGGGIFSDDTDVVVANCSIVDNACAWIGGGIAIIGGAPTIVDSVIADNASAQYAGGLYASGSDTTVSRCVVHGNTSGDDAAGFVLEQGSPVVENSVFYLNNGGDFGGAMDIWQETAALVVNNTFYDNDGPHGGGGVSIRSNLATVSSNVALLNTGTYGPDILPHGGYTPTVADNCYTPVFVDAASRNFRMTSNSPCIDVADDTLAPMTDFDGLDRVDIDDVGNPGTLADAGAFEYQP